MSEAAVCDSLIKLAIDQLPVLPVLPKSARGAPRDESPVEISREVERRALRLFSSMLRKHALEPPYAGETPRKQAKLGVSDQRADAEKWHNAAPHTKEAFRRLARFEEPRRKVAAISQGELEKKERVRKWREEVNKDKEDVRQEMKEVRRKIEEQKQTREKAKLSARRKKLAGKLAVWSEEQTRRDAEKRELQEQQEREAKLKEEARKLRTEKMKQQVGEWYASRPVASVRRQAKKCGSDWQAESKECGLHMEY